MFSGAASRGGLIRAGLSGRAYQGGLIRAGLSGRAYQGGLIRAGLSGRAYQGGLIRAGFSGRAYQGGLIRAGLSGRAYQGGAACPCGARCAPPPRLERVESAILSPPRAILSQGEESDGSLRRCLALPGKGRCRARLPVAFGSGRRAQAPRAGGLGALVSFLMWRWHGLTAASPMSRGLPPAAFWGSMRSALPARSSAKARPLFCGAARCLAALLAKRGV